jgi:ABC-type Zn uptake system ZnuABC Zn-binding protein ZnuA/ABC-type Mn2+/Zn2+ transport system permease subunit
MPFPFDLPYVQRAVLEIALLAIGAGLLGTFVVLRGLSFYAHAVGTAAFPGLVLADGLGFSALAGAFGTAAIVALLVAVLARRDREAYDSVTAMVLVGALAAGVILASDVFHSGSNVDRLLFGSLLVVDSGDQIFAAAMAGAVLVTAAVLGRRWLAAGFDPDGTRALGARSALPDLMLLLLIGAAAIAALDAVGALLATALLVLPAATTRLVFDRMLPWQVATVVLALVQGVGGVWLAVETNAPPGATIAVIGGATFALVAGARAALVARRGRQALAAASAALLAVLLGACGSSSTSSTGAVKVVATTTQLGDFVRNVGGPATDVTQILKPNTDPHEYEPRPKDINATAGAQVVFTSGDNLDAWMGSVIKNAGGHPRVVDVGAGRPDVLPGEKSGPEASQYDPHWWHDPRNVEHAVDVIRAALVKAEPAQEKSIDRSATAYEAKLRQLDRGIASCMHAVPATQRKLVTDHDAFGYFAKRYGITVIGAVIPSQTTQAQPSARDLAKLSALIKREHVRAVFPESSINAKLARALARETGASSNFTLYGDTLGPTGSAGATYIGMELANADAMVRGFTAGKQHCRIAGLR